MSDPITQFFLLAFCVLLCGVTFRIRGGLFARWHVPGQISRLSFAVMVSVTAFIAGEMWWHALLSILFWWISCTFPLGGWIDLGSNIDKGDNPSSTYHQREYRDIAMSMFRGLVWVFLPAMVLFGVQFIPVGWEGLPGRDYHWWWVLLCFGPAIVVDYWAGRQSGFKYKDLGSGGFPEVGEFFTGVTWGVASILAVQ